MHSRIQCINYRLVIYRTFPTYTCGKRGVHRPLFSTENPTRACSPRSTVVILPTPLGSGSARTSSTAHSQLRSTGSLQRIALEAGRSEVKTHRSDASLLTLQLPRPIHYSTTAKPLSTSGFCRHASIKTLACREPWAPLPPLRTSL